MHTMQDDDELRAFIDDTIDRIFSTAWNGESYELSQNRQHLVRILDMEAEHLRKVEA
jgi:hypothetical protein